MKSPGAPEPKKCMPAEEVLELCDQISREGVDIWIDGGWGVDALLGKQTRPHGDLDIVVQAQNLQKLRRLLGLRGYKNVSRDDTRDWNFVLGNEKGNEVDIHVITLDENGNGIYGPKENARMYPASALSGNGKIDGREIKCISAEYLIKSHTGYELDRDDYKDVSALCENFGIKLPAEYNRFERQD